MHSPAPHKAANIDAEKRQTALARFVWQRVVLDTCCQHHAEDGEAGQKLQAALCEDSPADIWYDDVDGHYWDLNSRHHRPALNPSLPQLRTPKHMHYMASDPDLDPR